MSTKKTKPKYTKKSKLARRRKWVRALESGKYEQTQGALAKDGTLTCPPSEGHSFCCLGVAARVCRLSWDTDCNGGELAKSGLAKLGLTAAQQQRLISLNDGYMKNFKQIATVIRKMAVN